MQNLRDCAGAAEQRISTVEDSLAPLSVSVGETSSELAALHAKVDDFENKFRCNNMHFAGFPEKSKETSSERFLHIWLKDTLGTDVLPATFAIECAHRTPLWPPHHVLLQGLLLSVSLIFKIKWPYFEQ